MKRRSVFVLIPTLESTSTTLKGCPETKTKTRRMKKGDPIGLIDAMDATIQKVGVLRLISLADLNTTELYSSTLLLSAKSIPTGDKTVADLVFVSCRRRRDFQFVLLRFERRTQPCTKKSLHSILVLAVVVLRREL